MRCLFSEFYQLTLNSTFTTQVIMAPPRQSFSVGEKISLIKKFHKSNQSLTSFCKENNIPRGTFQGFLKQKDELLNDGGDICRKRNSKGKHVILEDAVSLWVRQKNQQGVLPSNALIAQKALTLAKSYQIEDFTAGVSWMRRFKSRHNIN